MESSFVVGLYGPDDWMLHLFMAMECCTNSCIVFALCSVFCSIKSIDDGFYWNRDLYIGFQVVFASAAVNGILRFTHLSVLWRKDIGYE